MELWGRMLWTFLSGPGRRGGTFSSWQPHLPLSGLSCATELVSHWTGVFEKRGIPEARESSEYIVAHVLGAKTFQNLRPVLRTQPLTPQQLKCIRELSSCRLQRMPVQYILGEWDFQGLSLKMVPPVFIPRPETEELVEWVLEEVAQRSHAVGVQGGPLILEVGCGSGAISLSLLSKLPQVSHLHATLGRLTDTHCPSHWPFLYIPLLGALEGKQSDKGGQGCPQPTMVTDSNPHPCLSGSHPWPRGEKTFGYFLPLLVGGWRRVPRSRISQHFVSHIPFICSWNRAESLLWIRGRPPFL
ncbi:MTRF1L release factor glutamine methyltransferase isoform X2 [Lemur catta]|uniref:MTRF1L release factor glutamine methyltransferase isoform X2 n=1 Tax=Lemur catta TaxID=9447 RepID=UPI001E26E436|nr:MTRF1L release factor glutamine methyltransferase isoform X2 [Lemur catta]